MYYRQSEIYLTHLVYFLVLALVPSLNCNTLIGFLFK